ncbi:MAG TPA: Na+/H+ antiporter NhaA [Aquimonas sp.]|nr:Na+/H+ antiporter NhaA [Xanthomonadales bacterium]HRF53285.1 Na+/H+ antiporter NhaA [Aquimonas sp.]
MNTAQRDGLLLAGAAFLGLLIMNSPLASAAEHLLALRFQVGLGDWVLSKPVELWINDFLMAIFFLLVGVEIKHEWQHGSLSTPQARILPLGAAIGGMAVPALIFLVFNWNQAGNLSGWAIPAATDIAFAIGLMALAAPSIRAPLIAFLTAVAVIDDLGAIVVIALFYTDQLSKAMLGFAAVGVAALFILSSLRVQRIWPYVAVGLFLWVCVLKSGVHATLAGVVMGLFMPASQDGNSPAEKLDHALKPWVSWLILPLFGLTNAGVSLTGMSLSALVHPITLGIALGLLAGKPIGILLGTWIASRLGGGLPDNLRLVDYLPVALFCGIGFTMALFIGTLAYAPGSAAADAAKIGVLLGTVGAFVFGTFTARALRPRLPAAV